MFCKQCGKEVIEGASFCKSCGATVSPMKVKKSHTKFALITGLFIIAVIIFGALAANGVFDSSLEAENDATSANQGSQGLLANSPADTRQDLIRQGVQEARSQYVFPHEIDEVTTLTDIKEGMGAIRYEYMLHDIDESQVSNQVLKDMLAPAVCKNADTRNLLDKNIAFEYSYSVQASASTYFVSISRADCF